MFIYSSISRHESSTDVYSQSTSLNGLQLTFLKLLQLTAANSNSEYEWMYMTRIYLVHQLT